MRGECRHKSRSRVFAILWQPLLIGECAPRARPMNPAGETWKTAPVATAHSVRLPGAHIHGCERGDAATYDSLFPIRSLRARRNDARSRSVRRGRPPARRRPCPAARRRARACARRPLRPAAAILRRRPRARVGAGRRAAAAGGAGHLGCRAQPAAQRRLCRARRRGGRRRRQPHGGAAGQGRRAERAAPAAGGARPCAVPAAPRAAGDPGPHLQVGGGLLLCWARRVVRTHLG
jgi:hypothetical protein